MRLHWPRHTFIFYKILVLCAVLSLIFSFTNIVPFSATLSLFILAVPLLLLSTQTIPKAALSTLILFTYILIHTLIYAPESLLDFGYYRRDGNYLITIAPFLTLSLTRISLNLRAIVRHFIVATSFVNIVFLFIFATTGGTIFFHEEKVYHFLFEAHNAAGGFLAILSCFSLSYYLSTKNKFILFLFLTNLAGLFLTNSRGSLFGFLLAGVMVLLLKNKFNKIILVLIVLAQLPLFYFFYNFAPTDFLTVDDYSIEESDEAYVEREHTVVIRTAYLWPKAIYNFLQSPIFGTGFGSFNDEYSEFSEGELFHFIKPTNLIFSANHAHHTFLHVLSETGLVGLALLIYWLFSIYNMIWKLPFKETSVGFLMGFWVAVISSFTEHRLFTSSQMLPYFILLGLALSKYRWMQALSENRRLVPDRDNPHPAVET